MRMLRSMLCTLLVAGFVFFLFPKSVFAQITPLAPRNTPAPSPAVASTDASASAHVATSAAEVIQKIEEKKEKDITETSGQAKSRLARVLENVPAEPLSPFNFIRRALRIAINEGVPANVLVLLLLFPITASFVAASRHIIGMRSFGVYAPAVLSVVFLSTGIIPGLVIFSVILIVASVGRNFLQHLKLQYLPRTALLVWLVSLSVFGLLMASPWLLKVGIDIVAISIFPILVLVLLSENFLEAMLLGSASRAFGFDSRQRHFISPAAD